METIARKGQDFAIASTIISLKEIVTIVFGVTITHAIVMLVTGGHYQALRALEEYPLISVLCFSLLIANIIRFYHGNIRHIDDLYLREPAVASPADTGLSHYKSLSLDFFIVFLESLIFAAMSFYINTPSVFFFLFTITLGIDVIWYYVTSQFFPQKELFAHQKKWTLNNWGAILFIVGGYAIFKASFSQVNHFVFAGIVGLNTFFDFVISWHFYFPKKQEISKNVFLAAPFSGKIDEQTGRIPADYRSWLEKIIRHLQSARYEVYSCHDSEDWGAKLEEPFRAVKKDYERLRASGVVVAYLETPVSFGVCIELGIALAWSKKIILLAKDSCKIPFFAEGLHVLSDVHVIHYKDDEELLDRLDDHLQETSNGSV